MATSPVKRMIYQGKRELVEETVDQIIRLLVDNLDRNTRYITSVVQRTAKGTQKQLVLKWVREWLVEGNGGRRWLQNAAGDVHPNVRKRYMARLLTDVLLRDGKIKKCHEKYGLDTPFVMLISPSMRCNYRCRGCYAASYERKDDMRPEVMDRIMSEAEEIGINFFTILGGEPLVYPDLLDILKKHQKSYYQIYTNGSLLTKEMAYKIADMGNISPQLSINGPREITDATRGPGAFDKVVEAMRNLREARCVFGSSTLVTRENLEAICREEWVDFLADNGAVVNWMFMYMPVGEDPDMNLMPTPEQRNELRRIYRIWQKKKPLLFIDFWNYAPLVGGCIAGARGYFHVNHRGDVEPCIFCHFSTHNIHNCSLAEALSSSFFQGIRESQPFSYNTLRPCPMIDNYEEMWSLIRQHGAKPTHKDAEKMFTTFSGQMKNYCHGTQQILDRVWFEEDYHDWVPKMLSWDDIPAARIEARRQAFEASRKNK